MTQQTSPATTKPYSAALVCRVWEIPCSTLYFQRKKQQADASSPTRPGPAGPCNDETLLTQIRAVITGSSFQGEGYRKVWVRLRRKDVRTSKDRVRRLMRENGLRSPQAPGRERGNEAHDGTITTARPDQMWGTDATAVLTRREGTATIFIAVDHCTAECIGIHATASATRFEALEPLRQGIRQHFGRYEAGAAAGLVLRHDHGSQYLSRHFQDELRFLGITSSLAFVGEPECNGVSERFIRTLKEQLL